MILPLERDSCVRYLSCRLASSEQRGCQEACVTEMLTKPDGSLVQLTYEQCKCSTACLANGDACLPRVHRQVFTVGDAAPAAAKGSADHNRVCGAALPPRASRMSGVCGRAADRPRRRGCQAEHRIEQMECSEFCIDNGDDCGWCVGLIAGNLFD